MKLQVERRPLGQRIASVALVVLFVAVALTVAVDLLRQILPWLVVGAVLVGAGWLISLRIRQRRDRW